MKNYIEIEEELEALQADLKEIEAYNLKMLGEAERDLAEAKKTANWNEYISNIEEEIEDYHFHAKKARKVFDDLQHAIERSKLLDF